MQRLYELSALWLLTDMLYIVATPIGNLEDITLRALRVLSEVDFILCEDTRVSKKLLNKYEINTPLISYHQHSKISKIDKIIELINSGKSLALVTDAGTPGISDPGNELIGLLVGTRHCLAQDGIFTKKNNFSQKKSRTGQCPVPTETVDGCAELQIVPVPGPSAVAAALSVSGLPTNEFLFLGFLPHKKGRQTLVTKIIAADKTVVVYESCHRIVKFLKELDHAICNTKHATKLKLVVCRELTKMFESIYRGTPEEVLKILESDKNNLKGEFVVVIGK